MIDVNDVLRRAFEAGKMPPKPEVSTYATEAGRRAEDAKCAANGIMNMRRRPDGVWEMPE